MKGTETKNIKATIIKANSLRKYTLKNVNDKEY